jgi:hypothetical protein
MPVDKWTADPEAAIASPTAVDQPNCSDLVMISFDSRLHVMLEVQLPQG